ncbi:MAG: ABC transporter permease [Chloroflexi bacterium]|nr:ABC transporter permease [Chloroflexota bacterium]
MYALVTLLRKELADHLGSKRFVILMALVSLSGLSAIYVAGQSIRQAVGDESTAQFVFLKLFTASSGVLPPFVSFIAFFGPLIGLALGFDAINRERSSGTLALVMAQPIFRDSIVNGKFLAGVTTIAVMLSSIVLIVAGMGLWMIGVPPSLEEVLRIIAYTLVTVVYIGFWMALAMMFSIFFKRITTSALAAIAVWMFFSLFMGIIAGLVADRISPIDQDQSDVSVAANEQTASNLMRLSPATLYQESIATMLQPNVRTLGPLTLQDIVGMVPGPLPLAQSLLLVWPQIVTMIGLMLACFAISYASFMRQEIRGP